MDNAQTAIKQETAQKTKTKWGWYILSGAILYSILNKNYENTALQATVLGTYLGFTVLACWLYYKIKEKYLKNDTFKAFFVGVLLWLIFSVLSAVASVVLWTLLVVLFY